MMNEFWAEQRPVTAANSLTCNKGRQSKAAHACSTGVPDEVGDTGGC